MKMKTLMIIAVLLLLTSCTVAPDAGHEMVLVAKPFLFGNGGVLDQPVVAGRSFVWFSTDSVDVYVQPKKFETEMPDTMTSDGVPITFHAIVILQVTDSVKLVKNFGTDWYKNNVEEQFKSMVRQAVRKHGMNETAISTTALTMIDEEIKMELVRFLTENQLPVRLVTMTVGKANPPDAIQHQRVDTATQEQRANTEKQRKLAEDQRLAAEQSRANADNAYREAMHLSPEQFIQLKQIEMQTTVCGTAGKATCTFLQSGGVTPVYSVAK